MKQKGVFMKTSIIINRLLAVVAALSLGLALVSCGGSGSQSVSSANSKSVTTSSTSIANTADFVFPLDNPEVFLKNTGFDAVGETITLPLNKGMTQNGDTTWFIITDASDRDLAEQLGVNWAPKLANAIGTAAVQNVGFMNNMVIFPGTVDFTPDRFLMAGPSIFPPTTAIPGSVGDAAYSPLITKGDGIVLNAPQVANGTGLHDKVVNINMDMMAVTLKLTEGFYHDKGILYLSTDASDPVAATLEAATLAPNMDAAPGLASNDPKSSARAAIVPIVNGQTGVGNPDRQGLISAILGEGSPLNVTEIHPRNRGEIPIYSPLWDVHPAVWTDAAIAAGERRLVKHHEDIAQLVENGLLVSGGSGPPNPVLGGLRAAGFIVNCPIMALQ